MMKKRSLFQRLGDLIGLNYAGYEKTLWGWRKYTFRVMLNVSVITGAIALPTMLATLIPRGEWVTAILDTVTYLFALLLPRYILKEKHYKLRVIIFLSIFFITGMYVGYVKGSVGDARLWLLFSAVLAAILMGARAGITATSVYTMGWFLLAFLFDQGIIVYDEVHLTRLVQKSNVMSLWTNTGVVMAAIGFTLIAAVTAIFNNLSETLEETRTLAEQLEQEEKKYRLLFNNSPNLIMEVNQNFQILACNPAMAESLGYESDELVGKNIESVLAGHILDSRAEIAAKTFEQGLIQQFEDKRDGRYYNTVMIPNLERGSVQVVANDITSRKLAEEELIKYQNELEDRVEERNIKLKKEMAERERAEKTAMAAQKLADLGVLTTGVAHELNSPLQGIQSVSDLMLLELDQACSNPDFIEKQIKLIQESVSRCAKIVKSLRFYARMSPKDYTEQDLHELVDSTLLLAEHQLKLDDISIAIDIEEDIPSMICSRDQIMQVLINLLTNARDAMPGGGEIHIKGRFDLETRQFKLIFTDNGDGIPEEHMDQIYKPFFTTKPVGKGTGLGLFIVSGIVRAHGGEINIESQVGEGTTVTLTFPQQPPQDTEPAFFGRYADLI